ITFTSTAPAAVVGGAAYTVTATGGGSGNAVTFTLGSPTICAASGASEALLLAGSCTIDANQTGNASFAAAPQATQTFTVAPAALTPQTITFTSTAPAAVVGGAAYTGTVTGGGAGDPGDVLPAAPTVC